MTPEEKHLSEFLVSLVEKRFQDFSDYARENPETKKPYTKKQMIAELQQDRDFVEWLFLEGLRRHFSKDLLSQIEVDVEDDEDCQVFKVNDRFIKLEWGDKHAEFKFVNRKRKTIYVYE